ncbi:dienelactone hydrolase family protein [Domibacillus sp. A3M-37]|uniref:alpha/beta hydrolase n=1 Tax=Domibacillus sp. A3M-37 TaxID=2962037 RepID=UPI0020B8768B|nr:dienelactone hydrolase family protein [Domibacillus sp. A3M-37]MCP3763385.1 dienelactone hydrolase family protein [Domibacillus sp. A3M-37]
MHYALRQPAQVEEGRQYPAIFLMHGLGSNEQDLLPLLDELEDVYVFSIRGPLSQPPGFAFFTIQGFGNPHRPVFEETVEKITDFIDYACSHYSVDPGRLYTMGFSQGAILAMTLGLSLNGRIKGAAALSGYIPSFVQEAYPEKLAYPLSLFISHGETDPIFPLSWGEANTKFFKKREADVVFHIDPSGHAVSQAVQKNLIQWFQAINNGGEK